MDFDGEEVECAAAVRPRAAVTACGGVQSTRVLRALGECIAVAVKSVGKSLSAAGHTSRYLAPYVNFDAK